MVSIVRKRKHRAACQKQRQRAKSGRSQRLQQHLLERCTPSASRGAFHKRSFHFAVRSIEATWGSLNGAKRSRALASLYGWQPSSKRRSVTSSVDLKQSSALANPQNRNTGVECDKTARYADSVGLPARALFVPGHIC